MRRYATSLFRGFSLRFPRSNRFYSSITSFEPNDPVEGEGGISARVIADSIYDYHSFDGTSRDNRMITFELEYPRFIHSEFMTHRLLSKNSASSRAIPVSKMINNVREKTASPIHWGKNQRGMQAQTEHNELVSIRFNSGNQISFDTVQPDVAWHIARDSAIEYANSFAEAGYHKQIVNRLLEPFKMMKVVCSGTEFDNFFWLRCHADAQPEIRELARVMYQARTSSVPTSLEIGHYHLPYVTPEISEKCKEYENPQAVALKVSASCCAQVSYRKNDTSIEKAFNIYHMLVTSEPMHASPFEHQARPISDLDVELFDLLDLNPADCPITHMDRTGDYWSGNLRGFIQHRHEIPNNTCYDYNRITDRYV